MYPTVVWPITPVVVEPRSAERIELTSQRKLLVCQVDYPAALQNTIEFQALYNIDHMGPLGIEHLIVHAREVLPVLIINYGNQRTTVSGAFRCFDAEAPFKELLTAFKQWKALREGN